LRSPVQGIASHWDEWFRHEASRDDRDAIEAIGHNPFEQRRFVGWLAHRWAGEAQWGGESASARYALAQLSRVSPFDTWACFDRYQTTYGTPGIAAIVLEAESAGESDDVRPVEALILPADEDATAHNMVSDGFQAESGDLSAARRAAISLLNGRGLLVFLALWAVAGRRPYPRWLQGALAIAWLTVAGLMIRLLTGADPGSRLSLIFLMLFVLWTSLVVVAVGIMSGEMVKAWIAGRQLRMRLEAHQTRLRINGGLFLQGGSAGLAFCLNTLLATYRAHPRLATQSWLWDRFFRKLRGAGGAWAATGVVMAGGQVERVTIEPKIRACLRHPEITDILTPWQPEARQSVIDGLISSKAKPGARAKQVNEGLTPVFASEKHRLRTHRCRHAAQSIMAVGDFISKPQLVTNAFALAISAIMIAALPDIRNVLAPPPAPAVVQPASPSPYYLWISLDTKRAEAFSVVLESGFWSNRWANVESYAGADGSVRAELRLSRVGRQTTSDEEDGTISISRRRKFLNREFQSGDRVGSYSLSHVTRLGHE
jgi:hypothetical protein